MSETLELSRSPVQAGDESPERGVRGAGSSPARGNGGKQARTDWTRAEIAALFDLPFTELVFRAAAAEAKAQGSQRFCMGAAWRNPKDRDMATVVAMVEGVKAMGLETCMTLGMLEPYQAHQLAKAGLDYYNHNIDTSPEHYGDVITTRTFQDRVDTLENVRQAGINVCSGGIVGMGETRADRVGFVHALATLPRHPESVPVNALVPVKGTVLGDMLADTPLAKIDDIEFVRTVAVARITMPLSMVRLSAGRESMSEATQALCFMAGANSIFTGEKLLTTGNAGGGADTALFAKLGLKPMEGEEPMRAAAE